MRIRKSLIHYHLVTALLIFATAFGIRVFYNANTTIINPIRADAYGYVSYALNIINHHTFSKQTGTQHPTPDSYSPPGYPFFLAGVIAVSKVKNAYHNMLTTQAAVGASVAVLTFVTGLLFLPFWAAIAASVLVILSPHLISIGSYLLTETLSSFLYLLFFWLYSLYLKSYSSLSAIGAGMAAGFSYLVNPVIFFAPFLVALIGRKIHKKSAFSTAVFLISFMLPVGTWLGRNSLEVAAHSSSSYDRALLTFVIGAHPYYYLIYHHNPSDPMNPATLDMKRIHGSWTEMISLLAKRIEHRPWLYAKWYLLDKPALLWGWNIQVGQGDVFVYPTVRSPFLNWPPGVTLIAIMQALNPILITACLIGFLLLWVSGEDTNRAAVLALYVLLGYVSLVYIVLQSDGRYSIPLRPEMYLGAMFGLWQMVEWAKKLRAKSRKEPA